MRKIPLEYESPVDNVLLFLGDEVIRVAKNLGMTPNGLTTLSLIFGMGSVYALQNDRYVMFGICYMISYFFDCIDGAMARKYKMVSKFGDWYDHTKDLLVFGLIIYVCLRKFPITKNKYVYGGLALMYLIDIIHIDCQEKLYKKESESSFLSMLHGACIGDPKTMMLFTRYFATGSGAFITSLLPFLMKK